jgi:hypothetical protein
VADRSSTEIPAKRWLFPYFAFSAGILSLWAGGALGGTIAFGVAAALAWRSGRGGGLRWSLTALAVLCAALTVFITVDGGSGTLWLDSVAG